jgi:four helix bundle protein
MTYEEWEQNVPAEITGDVLWHMSLYRQALFIGELAWFDSCKLVQTGQTRELSDQLYRAAGGISTTICEGYSWASRKDQARFYEYSLGSARETRDWYYKGRHVLGEKVALHRLKLLVHVIRQLLKIVPEYRTRHIREEIAQYELFNIDNLLSGEIPMPD